MRAVNGSSSPFSLVAVTGFSSSAISKPFGECTRQLRCSHMALGVSHQAHPKLQVENLTNSVGSPV
jgi:hypothetical protein